MAQVDGKVETKMKTVEIETQKVEMKRELGLVGATSMVVGMIIGSGIFISPKGVLRATGSVGLCLVVWVLAGIVQLGTNLCYAELGTLIPLSGGQYTYLKKGLGNPLAFTFVVLNTLITSPGSLVVILLTFSKYLVALLPTCGSPVLLEKCVAAAAVVTITLVNAHSTRLAARLTIITTIGKVSALVVIIGGGIIVMSQGTTTELGTGFSETSKEPSSLALALYSAMWAYGGGENLNNVAEEVKNPSKNLPRALILGVAMVIVIYTLTNMSYLAVMTRHELLAANAVAVVFGQRAMSSIARFVPLAVMVSTFGAANNGLFSNSRTVFAAARDRNIPDVLSYIQIHHLTPLSAMSLTAALALILLVPADVGHFINYLAFIGSFFNSCIFLTLIVLRLGKMKDAKRIVKIPLVIPILMLLVNIYMFTAPLVIEPQLEFVYVAIGVFGGSALLYIPFIYFRLHPPLYDRLVSWLQLTFLLCPPTKMVE